MSIPSPPGSEGRTCGIRCSVRSNLNFSDELQKCTPFEKKPTKNVYRTLIKHAISDKNSDCASEFAGPVIRSLLKRSKPGLETSLKRKARWGPPTRIHFRSMQFSLRLSPDHSFGRIQALFYYDHKSKLNRFYAESRGNLRRERVEPTV